MTRTNPGELLRGTPASKGVAEGIVHIVRDATDTPQFQDGEILVTTMTEPTMVMMMNKAAAVVTDDGGITCHAAIVSRELVIPAIVGTGTATTALRDGMHVRVDGTSGIVTQL